MVYYWAAQVAKIIRDAPEPQLGGESEEAFVVAGYSTAGAVIGIG